MAVEYSQNVTSVKAQAACRTLTAATRALAAAIAPVPAARSGAPPASQDRWATIASVNLDGTVNITLDGQLVSEVPVKTGYIPDVGDVVLVAFIGTDLVVEGALGQQDVVIGQELAGVTGPASGVDVVNAAVNVISVSAALVAGHTYNVYATGDCTVITAVPAYVNMQIHDTTSGQVQFFMSLNSPNFAVSNQLAGGGVMRLTPVSANATHTITFFSQGPSPGAGVRFLPNSCQLSVVRTG